MRKSAAALFRQRLKEIRKARNLTQEQAAVVIGMPHKVYQFYELGVKANPTLATVEKICIGFGIEVHDLFAPSSDKKTK